MKKIFIASFALLAIACGNSTQPAQENSTPTDSVATDSVVSNTGNFGDVITADSAITLEELKKAMAGKTELAVKVTAPVSAVCQKKGCWMELKGADATTMRVTFKDYGFFVPLGATGTNAVVSGVAKVEKTSIADLKEYAKDDGKSTAEIDAITQPKEELVFEANGVILQ